VEAKGRCFSELEEEIYKLRKQLNELGDCCTELSSLELLQLSQKLDTLLNAYERQKKESLKNRADCKCNRPEA